MISLSGKVTDDQPIIQGNHQTTSPSMGPHAMERHELSGPPLRVHEPCLLMRIFYYTTAR